MMMHSYNRVWGWSQLCGILCFAPWLSKKEKTDQERQVAYVIGNSMECVCLWKKGKTELIVVVHEKSDTVISIVKPPHLG